MEHGYCNIFCLEMHHLIQLLLQKVVSNIVIAFQNVLIIWKDVRDHPLSTYAKVSKKLTFLTPWYAQVRVRIRGFRNVSFSENFAYALNRWTLISLVKIRIFADLNSSQAEGYFDANKKQKRIFIGWYRTDLVFFWKHVFAVSKII